MTMVAFMVIQVADHHQSIQLLMDRRGCAFDKRVIIIFLGATAACCDNLWPQSLQVWLKYQLVWHELTQTYDGSNTSLCWLIDIDLATL